MRKETSARTNHVEAAKEVLRDEGKLTTDQDTGLMPAKPAIQVVQPNNSLLPKPEQDADELHRLENVFEGKSKEAWIAMRDIRDNRRWVADGYTSWKDYLAERHGKTEGWASQNFHRIEVEEILAAKCITMRGLSTDAVQDLNKLEDEPECMVRAYLDATENGVTKPIAEKIKKAVQRQQDFILCRKNAEEEGVPELTFAEFEAVAQFRGDVFHLSETDIDTTKPVTDQMVALCNQHGKMPNRNTLVELFRGQELFDVCKTLSELKKEFDRKSKAQSKVDTLSAQLEAAKKDAAVVPAAPAVAAKDEDADTDEPEDVPTDADEDDEDEEELAYTVTLTGDFAAYAPDGSTPHISTLEKIEMMLQDFVMTGKPITQESTITFKPIVKQ